MTYQYIHLVKQQRSSKKLVYSSPFSLMHAVSKHMGTLDVFEVFASHFGDSEFVTGIELCAADLTNKEFDYKFIEML